jgi:two-component system NtrC family sensor kinase
MVKTEADVKISLVHQEKDGNFTTFKIQKLPVTLGREVDNDIAVSDKSVSRMHAEIFLKKKKLFIKDLGSHNGTFVNDQKITSSPLSADDLLRLGKTYELKVRIGEQKPDIAREEWDLSTKLISPEELEIELKKEGEGEVGASTGSVLAFFQKAGKILEDAFELEDIVRGILDLTFQIIPATRGFVLLVDPETGEMVVKAKKFREGEAKEPRGVLDLSTTILDHAIKHGKAVLTLDAGRDERFGTAESVRNQKIRGAICVPLKGRTEILGAIYVHSGLTSTRFTVNDLKLLTAVGAEMGVAVENVRLYKDKIKSERLAAVGQAIAGLGHCIKNILNGMEGGSFILQKGLDKGADDTIREGWDILRRNNSKLKDLMLDMLAYSKPREPVYAETPGNAIPKEVIELLSEKAKSKGVSLRFIPDDRLGKVMVDGKAIYRGVLNLITNAIDACSLDGGEVEVNTHLLPESEQFQVVVKDNGQGIPEENIAKLGKAFFSTRGAEGTGLGLCVTYKVIEEHKGHIHVDSKVGTGTTFAVTLPLKGPFSS